MNRSKGVVRMFLSRMKLLIIGVMLVVFTSVSTAFMVFSSFPGGVYGADRLWKGMRTVSGNYYESVDDNKLVDGALQGMVKALGDPYSAYMNEKAYTDFQTSMKGSFSGVGMTLGMKDSSLIVVSPIEGTPSAKAGVKSGDVIRKINGEDTENFTVEDAVTRIRGEAGTSVSLVLDRKDKDGKISQIEVSLMRENIVVPSVYGKMMKDDVGYIRLTQFGEHTTEDFREKLKELDGQGMKRLVLDLRNNGGGLLNSAVDITGLLLKEGEVVSTIGRDGNKQISRSGGKTDRYEGLVVLINEGSASASEIVAGAIQDRKGGTLVGVKSFGKGSVQIVYPLDEQQKTAIRLTIAKYFTPSGRSIHGIGLEPDVLIQWGGEGPPFEIATDPQLKKAMEVLQR